MGQRDFEKGIDIGNNLRYDLHVLPYTCNVGFFPLFEANL